MSKVLITGANRGIGLALAGELVARGHEVIATARNPESATELQALDGGSGKLHIVALDVTDAASVSAAAGVVAEKFGSLDILINNAGIYPEGAEAAFESIDHSLFEQALEVNLLGVIRVTRALLPLVRKGDAPRIVNVSSGAASISRKSDGRRYCYGTSKAALNMFTRTLAFELRSQGVVVVALSPGWVKTDMGGDHADLEVADVAPVLVDTFLRLGLEKSGEFLDRFGSSETYAW